MRPTQPFLPSLLLIPVLICLGGCGGGGGPRSTVGSVQPAGGAPGTAAVLTGSGLDTAVDIRLGGVDLAMVHQGPGQVGFTLPSWMPPGDWPVQAVLADGELLATGTVFQAQAPEPVISGVYLTAGPVGQRVQIAGRNFHGTGAAVTFGGIAATIETVSPQLITVVVPPGAQDGPIGLTSPAGPATAPVSFQVLPPPPGPPDIGHAQPVEAPPGVSINVYGYRLLGTSAITFNGIPAPTFSVVYDGMVRVTVPPGATDGPLTLVTPGGASSTPFHVLPPSSAPVITSLDPASTFEDQYINITGTNLSSVTRASIGDVDMDFIRFSDTALEVLPDEDEALVPGFVTLTSPAGEGTSLVPFTLLPRVPAVDGLTPRIGGPGTPVAFSGINLDQVASVSFGGASTTDIQERSRDRFIVPLPPTALAGPVTLTTLNGATIPIAGVFTLGSGAPLSYSLERAYITQGIQDGSVTLVAGKRAAFRAFVLANQANSAQPGIRVTLRNSAGLTVFTRDLPGAPGGVPENLDENVPGPYTAAVPGDLIQPGLTLLAELLPDPLAPNGLGTPATFPANGTPMPLVVQAYPVLNISLVPLQYRSSPGGPVVTGRVDQSPDSWLGPIQAMYPLATINITVAPPLDTGLVVSANTYAEVEALQARVEVARMATPGAGYQNWHGVFGDLPAGATSGYGLPGLPGSQAGRSSVGIDGMVQPDYGYAETLAHETGHTKGRDHSPCGGAPEPDPSYPYPPARLGAAAFDMAAMAPVDNRLHYDLMSYCFPYWISAYTYQGLQAWFLADIAAPPATPQASLAISGRIRSGTVTLDPALEFQAVAEAPPPGPCTLRCLDSAGRTLQTVPFQPAAGADPASRSFVFLIPMTPALQAGLASLQVDVPGAGNSRPASDRRDRAALALAREPVAVAWGGKAHVGWDHGTHPLVLVREPGSGRVLAFGTGGEVEVITAARELELLMSDGVRTTVRRVAVGP